MSSPSPESPDVVVRRHWNRLVGFLRSLKVPEGDIDDLVHEVWMRALGGTWDGEPALLLHIARQRVIDWRAKRRPTIDGDLVDLAAAPTRPEAVGDAERLAECLEKLRQQNARFHTAVVAFYYDASTDAEVAAAQGVSPATVRSGRHKGLAFLKECVGADAE